MSELFIDLYHFQVARLTNFKSSVLMKTMTWDRESHGLYDYESKRITKYENKTSSDGELVRGREEVFFDQTKSRPGNSKSGAEEQEDEET